MRNVSFQTQEWIHAVVLPEEGALPSRRLLLEEAQGRQDHEGGPHEAQGPGHGGELIAVITYIITPIYTYWKYKAIQVSKLRFDNGFVVDC